jgi:O-antigen/teichoic acid export membrane protein
MGSSGVQDVLGSAEAGGKVVRGAVWRVAGSLTGILAGLATATLLLRHLGVVESGRYVTVLALVAIGSSVVDIGLNVSASRELALRDPQSRAPLMANVIGQRLWISPLAAAAMVAFALLAGYPTSMQIGALLAGAGLYVVAVADALLLPLTVELRSASLAVVDILKPVVTLSCVAVLVALGAHLTPFYAVMILTGLSVIAITPALAGRRAFVAPRLDRVEQRDLLKRALPLAMALVLSQVYFRLVILIMSIVSDPKQTGYFGGSLRAMETLVGIPTIVAGVALPLLAAAARDDRPRMLYAIEGLTEGALIAGVLAVLLASRGAVPVMKIIGGESFGPAGAVLRIQIAALMFGAMVQIWAVSLVALGRQRDLILINAVGLLGLAVFVTALVPAFGAQGGAAASVLGDALLAALTWWRLRADGVNVELHLRFLGRLALASAAAVAALVALPGLPGLAAAALAGVLFLAVGQLVGLVPRELHDALWANGLLRRRSS